MITRRLPVATALLLLLASALVQGAETQQLFDGEVEVWPAKLRTLDVPERAGAARVSCSYTLLRGSSAVRMLLVRLDDGQRIPVAETAYGSNGALSHYLDPSQQYRLVVENRRDGRTPAVIALRAKLVRSPSMGARPSRVKQAVLVGGSTALFLLAAGYSGVRLRRALQQRRSLESSGPFG